MIKPTMLTDYTTAKATKLALETEVNEASDALQVFPRGSMGLLTDEARQSPEYRIASLRYNRAFFALRAFNRDFLKRFKREYATDRKSRFTSPVQR